MSRIIQIQNDFTAGELDPKLRARTDLQQYNSGLTTARNVTIQPQGGAKRRPGTKFIHQLDSGAANAVRMVPFEFSVNDSYMLVFTPGKMYVYKDGALVTNINSSGNNFLTVSSLTASILPEMNWIQSADTLIVVHGSLPPTKIVRGANDSSWTASTISFDFAPYFAFSISTQAGSSPFNGVSYSTLTPNAASGNVRLVANGNIFTGAASNYVNQYINVTPFGRLRIVRKVSTSTLLAFAEVPLFDTEAITPANWELETGYELTWSSTRGYPKAVTFHEGRLYFGGTATRPSTIFGSRVGDFFNFDPGEALDDAAVEATMDTGTFNAIIDMYSSTHLQIFTSGGEFYVPQGFDEPITPTNLIVKAQTHFGSKPGIRVQNLDGSTLFIQRQGKALQEFIYSDAVQAYTSAKISLLSSHLLKSPEEMAVRRSTSTDEGDRLLIVNGTDGSIACYTVLRSQQVIAPSEWTTDGEFINVGVDVNEIYVVVKRSVNGSTVYYTEIFDSTALLDSSKVGTSASSTTMDHLQAATVKIVRDGIVEPDQTVPASPFTITFATAASSTFQVGLNFTPEVKTLPVEPRLASGSLKGFKKRIFEVNAELFETQALTINGKEVSFRNFGASVLDDDVDEFTGIKTLHGILGYTFDGQITIGQTVPLKMTLLGIDYKVSAGQ
ncbi:MAG: hypothetical protein VX332_03685 [Pseudomonadota bacterium]|nr:hypothetical protein [Pseudomonadota bacterium]MEC7970666.1 hypothetical protein [Pseudomonadota bacterium]MEC7991351.1 hypothetical protein [Pseudomonadota bacterium]MEE3173958.1 hypothetical protein [Pseudomonadota bacterium]|tara:strand:- start:1153 stop:3159 length:2007 start_codon:yes stop_codon:yes gene_type:complete